MPSASSGMRFPSGFIPDDPIIGKSHGRGNYSREREGNPAESARCTMRMRPFFGPAEAPSRAGEHDSGGILYPPPGGYYNPYTASGAGNRAPFQPAFVRRSLFGAAHSARGGRFEGKRASASRSGGIGRRAGFKIPSGRPGEGSSPSSGINTLRGVCSALLQRFRSRVGTRSGAGRLLKGGGSFFPEEPEEPGCCGRCRGDVMEAGRAVVCRLAQRRS